MKRIFLALILSSLLFTVTSCERDKVDSIDFHKIEDRIGIWINSSRNDTLDFKDETNLVRKGEPYNYEEYLYRIDGDTLFVKHASSTFETQHVISDLNGKSVILSNMYITIGFADGSGIFTKQDTK
jgi:hypothetical protein